MISTRQKFYIALFSCILLFLPTLTFASSTFYVKYYYPANVEAPETLEIKLTKPIQTFSVEPKNFSITQNRSVTVKYYTHILYDVEADYKIINYVTQENVGSIVFLNPGSPFYHAYVNVYFGNSHQQHTELPFGSEYKTVNLNWKG